MSRSDPPRGLTSSNMACQNCDTQHTRQFARVFSDSNHIPHHCGDYDEIGYCDLKWGAGSNPDYDPETDRGSSSEHMPIFNRGDFDDE